MNRLIAWVLVAAACVGLASAGSAQAQWNDPAVVATLKQIEQDMGDAMVAVDIEKLNRIFADDWTSIGASGNVLTKEKCCTTSSPASTGSKRSNWAPWTCK